MYFTWVMAMRELTASNLSPAVEVPRLPEEIRGFGAIELRNRESVRRRERRLLDRFLEHEHLPVLEDLPREGDES